MYQSLTPNLMVDNVEESITFYQEKLGFSIITTVPNAEGGLQFAILAKDNISLMFQSKVSLVEEYPNLNTAMIKPSLSLFIKVTDILELYENLKGNVPILKEMHDTFYQTKEFAIMDANGNVLTIAE